MSYLLLNTNFETDYVVDAYDSCIWSDRYSSFGDFELHIAASKAAVAKFQGDMYLWSSESPGLMIVEDTEVKADVETGGTMVISGRSLESILDRRIIWGQTNLVGSLQTAIQQLLNENIIAPSDTTRRVPNLSFLPSTDPLVTSLQVDASFMGENLYDTIVILCQAYDIGFRITMPTNGQFVFELYSGADRSYNQTSRPTIVFSPDFDNLANSHYKKTIRKAKSIALIGGEGQGSAKRFASKAVRSGAKNGLQRREMYVDASSVSSAVGSTTVPAATYVRQLQQKGAEALSENTTTILFDGKAEMLRSATYNRDFFMGDILQMEDAFGNTSTSRVTEFIRSSSPTGEEAYPTLESIEL